jgi:hypothetical protein
MSSWGTASGASEVTEGAPGPGAEAVVVVEFERPWILAVAEKPGRSASS